MGRAKLNMELISKEKSRNITFKKRKEGLIRKIHEFTTLCDVSACMIIYCPNQENSAVEPEVWPQNLGEINRIIDIYKAKKKDSGNKTFGLNDFFHERKRKIEDELSKLRKRNMEAKYPTWVGLLDFMNEGQLREFAAVLSNKAEYVKSRIEVLRRSSSNQAAGVMDMNGLMDFSNPGMNSQFYPPPHPLHDISFSIPIPVPVPIPIPIHYPTMDHHQHVHSVNQNSMMMLLMNDSEQPGGASSSGANIQRASFKHQVYHEASPSSPRGGCGVFDPTFVHNRRSSSFARYYSPQLPQPPPPQQPPPYLGAPPQLHFSTSWDNQDSATGRADIVQYDMKNHGDH